MISQLVWFWQVDAAAAVSAAQSYSAGSLDSFVTSGYVGSTINAAIPKLALQYL